MRVGLSAMLCCVGVGLGAGAFGQEFPETSNLRIAEGLAAACRGLEGRDPLCAAYLIGVLDGIVNGQVIEAMSRNADSINPAYCAPPQLTYGAIAQLFLVEVGTFPENAKGPSAVVLTSALRRAFPCN
jgi:F0F1-type ATP synthase membrane subunit c/vacuolar-type H+-ATPase subunit K